MDSVSKLSGYKSFVPLWNMTSTDMIAELLTLRMHKSLAWPHLNLWTAFRNILRNGFTVNRSMLIKKADCQ